MCIHTYLCVGLCTCMWVPLETRRCQIPGVGVTGSCDLHDIHAGNWTQFLGKCGLNQRAISPAPLLSHLSGPSPEPSLRPHSWAIFLTPLLSHLSGLSTEPVWESSQHHFCNLGCRFFFSRDFQFPFLTLISQLYLLPVFLWTHPFLFI